MKVTKGIIEATEKRLGSDYTVKKTDVKRPNGTEREAVTVTHTEEIAPVVYVDAWPDMTDEDAAEKIAEIVENAAREVIKYAGLDICRKDRDDILSHIMPEIINTAASADYLAGKVTTEFYDLSIIYRYIVNISAAGIESIVITQDLLDAWEVSREDLHAAAVEYVKEHYTAQSMAAVMAEMIGETPDVLEDMAPPLVLVSNDTACYGAAVLIVPEIIEDVARRMGGDCYIIPSSIHEILMAPCDIAGAEDVRDMVASVNGEHVAPHEVLSNTVYKISLSDGAEIAPV